MCVLFCFYSVYKILQKVASEMFTFIWECFSHYSNHKVPIIYSHCISRLLEFSNSVYVISILYWTLSRIVLKKSQFWLHHSGLLAIFSLIVQFFFIPWTSWSWKKKNNNVLSMIIGAVSIEVFCLGNGKRKETGGTAWWATWLHPEIMGIKDNLFYWIVNILF